MASSSSASSSDDEETSTLPLLEHINLNVPDHSHALPFYTEILRCGLDTRRAGNVAKGSGTIWADCGASQFHLPHGDVAQVLPGHVGLRYESLGPLKERLKIEREEKKEKERCFASYEIGIDERTEREHVKIVDRYGNVFYCREGPPGIEGPKENRKFSQPIVSKNDASTFGEEIAAKYGTDETECRGIDYVEFDVPRGTADAIAEFYDCVFDAPISVVEVETAKGGGKRRGGGAEPAAGRVAIVGVGTIDAANGRASQCLLFRETDGPIPPYDGHHIAMYVGRNAADFEKAFKNCAQVGVVWKNPRFKDDALDLKGARKWKQFRFKDIVNVKDGTKIFELEHEMRSVEHDAWPGT